MTQPVAAIPPATPAREPARPDPPGLVGLEYGTLDDMEIPESRFWADENGPSFGELLDIVNPLHHLPVISSIYRAVTGDQIGAGPRLLGGALFGGPIGAVAAGLTALVEEASGGEIGTHVADLVKDVFDDGAPSVAGKPEATTSAGQQAATGDGPASSSAASAAPAATGAAAAAAASDRRGSAVPAGIAAALRADLIRARAAETPAGEPPASFSEAESAPGLNRIRYNPEAALGAPGLAGGPTPSDAPAAEEPAAGERRAAKPAHPFLPPPDASPEWIARAMERALEKYGQGRAAASAR